ncbi:hypothetical protein [Candidatus Nitrospira bockiana]
MSYNGTLQAGLLVLLLAAGCAVPETAVRVGTVRASHGNAFVGRPGEARPSPLTVGSAVYVHDVVETQPYSQLEIVLDGPVALTLGPGTRLIVDKQVRGGKTTVVLDRGAVRTHLQGTALQRRLFTSPVEVMVGEVLASGRDEFVVWGEELPHDGGAADPALRSIGVANTGGDPVAWEGSSGPALVVRPGYFSVTVPEHPPIPPVPIERARPFLSAMVQTTSILPGDFRESVRAAATLTARHDPVRKENFTSRCLARSRSLRPHRDAPARGSRTVKCF